MPCAGTGPGGSGGSGGVIESGPSLMYGLPASEEDGAIVLHPPLYYALMAPVYALVRSLPDPILTPDHATDDKIQDPGTVRLIRHFSPLLLLAALLLYLGILRRVFPGRPFAVAAG